MGVEGVCSARKWAKISIKTGKRLNKDTVKAAKALRQRVIELPSLATDVVVQARIKFKQEGILTSQYGLEPSVRDDYNNACYLLGYTSCSLILKASTTASPERRRLSASTASKPSASDIIGQGVYDVLKMYFVMTVEVDANGPFVKVLVEDDQSANLVNQLGVDKLVAVRPPSTTTTSTATTTTTGTTKPIATTTTVAAAQRGLSTKVTASASEVNVFVIAKSEKVDLETTSKEWLEP